MIGKFVLCLSTAAISLIGLCGSTIAATKNVDIVVTHNVNSPIATYTIQETSGKDQPAGKVYIAGQGFRRGDVPPGNCAALQDAATHNKLIYQLDEISTRVENGDDGSIRHLVFSVQLPAIAANSMYAMEWVRIGSPCPTASQKQPLSAFTAAHDLKIDFSDVRNQDGSLRDTGHMVFSVNAAAASTGRDAPRKYATGPVRDGWIVTGAPTYVGSGNTDPLIYVTCYLDLTTDPGNQTSLGPIRHVCRVDNPWEKVAAGSSGLGTGPAGFANDPQGIYYRPQVFDGATSLVDWSRLDRSVTAGSNPINLATGQWTIPNTNMANDDGASWFESAPFCLTTSGIMPTGFPTVTPCGSSGKLVFAAPDYPYLNDNNVVFAAGPQPRIYRFAPVTDPEGGSTNYGAPTSQGTGTYTFSYRTFHYKFMSWFTMDNTGLENWLDGGSNAHQPIYPALTSGEKLYWQQTGVVPPIDLSQTPNTASVLDLGFRIGYSYNPMSRTAVKGGSTGGPRADIGIVNEFASQAMILQTPAAWDHARAFALGTYGYKWILNEATGRIPAMNNGPPVGPAGNGIANSYSVLGAPQPAAFFQCNHGGRFGDIVSPLDSTPVPDVMYVGGLWGGSCGIANDHLPNFDSYQYTIFGSRHYLDNVYFAGMRAMSQFFPGPADGFRDNIIDGNHYWSTGFPSEEARAGYWFTRDIGNCARFGADGTPERNYCRDLMIENGNYWNVYLPWKDGPSNTNITDCACIPKTVANYEDQTFMDTYGVMTFYMNYVNLRDPMAYRVLSTHAAKNLIALGGDVPGGMSSYYMNTGGYSYSTSLRDAGHRLFGPNTGQYYDNNMAHQNISSVYPIFDGTGTITVDPRLNLTPGDTVWSFNFDPSTGSPQGPDELQGGIGYVVTSVDNAAHTFKLVNPATGLPFPTYNFGGVPFMANFTNMGFHAQYRQPTSWWGGDGGYSLYFGSELAALKILGLGSVSFLGKTVNDAYNTAWNVRGIISDPTGTWIKWDGSVVVP